MLWIFALNKSMTYFGILWNLAYFSHARGGCSVYFAVCMYVTECVCRCSGPKRVFWIYIHWPAASVELWFRSDSECLLTTDLRPSLPLMVNDCTQDWDVLHRSWVSVTRWPTVYPECPPSVQALTVPTLHNAWIQLCSLDPARWKQ